MANDAINTVRAVLGQGLAMGFGDEAEAWLRSKLGDEEYEKALKEIRGEYGTFAQESPYLQVGGEFVGSAVPAVASMLVPGTQGAAPGALARMTVPLTRLLGLGKTAGQRTFGQNLARVTGASTAQGAVSGAGTAEEGGRGQGAFIGGLTGGAIGATLPVLGQFGSGASRVLRETVVPSTEKAREWAIDKLRMSLDQTNPAEINRRVAEDLRMGVPPTIANVTPGTVQLAETVVQRGGQAGRELEEVIAKQQEGSRLRVAEKVKSEVSPENFFTKNKEMLQNLRANADTAYDAAYAVGEINDPVINRILTDPKFKSAFESGKEILASHRLAAELKPGGDPSKFVLREIYDPQSGQMVSLPDVKTLDYIKQGIDETIEQLFSSGRSAQAYALKDVREQFVNRLDELVPEYKAARAQYRGDKEVLNALEKGKTDFTKMAPEELADYMATVSQGEKDAFRIGVARNLYDTIANPTQNINAAQRLIGGLTRPEAIGTLFDSPAQRDFFLAALNRESQIYKTANQILSGSPTARRQQMKKGLEQSDSVLEGAANTFTQGGFMNSVLNSAANLLRKGVPDSYYEELSKLLSSSDPAEIAAAVKLIEELEKKLAGRQARLGMRQAAYTSGTIGAMAPAPLPEDLGELPEDMSFVAPEYPTVEPEMEEEEELPLP
jgi:hypothetical protein